MSGDVESKYFQCTGGGGGKERERNTQQRTLVNKIDKRTESTVEFRKQTNKKTSKSLS